jgi:hypothetical protein
MNLNTYKEKEAFLKQCYEHINRIHRDLAAQFKSSAPIMTFELSKHPKSLPLAISMEKIKSRNILGELKLEILVGIYNDVAHSKSQEQEEPLELASLFRKTKLFVRSQLNKECSSYASWNIDNVMKEHRYKTGFAFLDWIINLFPTSSASFLKEYGFFEPEASLCESVHASIPPVVDPKDVEPTDTLLPLI